MFVYKDKKEEIWHRNVKGAKWQHKQRHKKVRFNSDCGPKKIFDMKFQYNSYRKSSKNVQTILERIEQWTELKYLIKYLFVNIVIRHLCLWRLCNLILWEKKDNAQFFLLKFSVLVYFLSSNAARSSIPCTMRLKTVVLFKDGFILLHRVSFRWKICIRFLFMDCHDVLTWLRLTFFSWSYFSVQFSDFFRLCFRLFWYSDVWAVRWRRLLQFNFACRGQNESCKHLTSEWKCKKSLLLSFIDNFKLDWIKI